MECAAATIVPFASLSSFCRWLAIIVLTITDFLQCIHVDCVLGWIPGFDVGPSASRCSGLPTSIPNLPYLVPYHTRILRPLA